MLFWANTSLSSYQNNIRSNTKRDEDEFLYSAILISGTGTKSG